MVKLLDPLEPLPCPLGGWDLLTVLPSCWVGVWALPTDTGAEWAHLSVPRAQACGWVREDVGPRLQASSSQGPLGEIGQKLAGGMPPGVWGEPCWASGQLGQAEGTLGVRPCDFRWAAEEFWAGPSPAGEVGGSAASVVTHWEGKSLSLLLASSLCSWQDPLQQRGGERLLSPAPSARQRSAVTTSLSGPAAAMWGAESSSPDSLGGPEQTRPLAPLTFDQGSLLWKAHPSQMALPTTSEKPPGSARPQTAHTHVLSAMGEPL